MSYQTLFLPHRSPPLALPSFFPPLHHSYCCKKKKKATLHLIRVEATQPRDYFSLTPPLRRDPSRDGKGNPPPFHETCHGRLLQNCKGHCGWESDCRGSKGRPLLHQLKWRQDLLLKLVHLRLWVWLSASTIVLFYTASSLLSALITKGRSRPVFFFSAAN
jgi:hypothetical protein